LVELLVAPRDVASIQVVGLGHASYGGYSVPEKTNTDASNWMMPLGVEAMMQIQRPTLSAMAEVNTRL
jgi:hypothetical protein